MAGSPFASAVQGRCPRCDESGLFDGVVSFAPRCGRCGLDFASFNVGDGPAAFLILIVGALLVIGAVALELSASPPWWVHLLGAPVGLGLTLAGLRVAKALLLTQEYRVRAREGRLAE